MQPPSSVPTLQPRTYSNDLSIQGKTGNRRKIEPMPDAFAIRSTKGRARSNRRQQQAAAVEEEMETEVVQTADDDFLGLSTSQKPHQRKHVDAEFEDFEISTSTTSRKPQETAGSFWDDNEGEEEEEKGKDDFWESSSTQKKKKEPEAVDRFLDGLGDMLSIKISDDVHTNVKSAILLPE